MKAVNSPCVLCMGHSAFKSGAVSVEKSPLRSKKCWAFIYYNTDQRCALKYKKRAADVSSWNLSKDPLLSDIEDWRKSERVQFHIFSVAHQNTMLALVHEFVNGSLNFAQLSVLAVSEFWTWARIVTCFSKAICSHIRELSFLKLLHTLYQLGGDPTCFQPRAPQNGKTLFTASCPACQILSFAYAPLPNKGVFLSVSPNAGVQSFRENYHNQPWKIASQVQGLKNIIFSWRQ